MARDAVQMLPCALLSNRPYEVEAAVGIRSNPVYTQHLSSEFQKALSKVPFLVCISSFLDETAREATIVLPESTALESWTEDEISHLAGFSCVSFGAPAMEPLYDTKPAYEILTGLAAGRGGSVAASVPDLSIAAAIRHRAKGLYDGRRGSVRAAGEGSPRARRREDGSTAGGRATRTSWAGGEATTCLPPRGAGRPGGPAAAGRATLPPRGGRGRRPPSRSKDTATG